MVEVFIRWIFSVLAVAFSVFPYEVSSSNIFSETIDHRPITSLLPVPGSPWFISHHAWHIGH